MKHFLPFLIVFAVYTHAGYAQNTKTQAQRITTDPLMGIQVELQPVTGTLSSY
jgi:hypothetical protein